MVINGLISVLKSAGIAGGRVRAFNLEEGDLAAGPSLVANRVSSAPPVQDFTGDAGLSEIGVQIDAYAKTRQAAIELADAVHDLLDNSYGTLPDGTVLQVLLVANEDQDFFEPDTEAYRVYMQFTAFVESEGSEGEFFNASSLLVLLHGDITPSIAPGVAAAKPALYVKNSDGSVWSKTGAADTDWTQLNFVP